MKPQLLRVRMLVAIIVLATLSGVVHGEDWPGWRGADRTDISRETNLLKQWPREGPLRVWLYKDAGVGYSGFAIVDNRLLTIGTQAGKTLIFALDANTGEELWATPTGTTFENRWGNGPRATPTVDGDRVYAMSAAGDLLCVQAATGEIEWQRNMSEFSGKLPKWGYSESVLVDGDRVICTPGGNVGLAIALDKHDGKLIWQTEELSGQPHYSSFIRAEHNGRPQYIQLTKTFVFGVEPESGDVLWQSDWNGRTAVVSTPIYRDGKVYITSGYGVGCKLVSIADGAATDIYKNKVMKNHHGGVILIGDYLYGHSDGTGWVCQNFEDGELVWQEKRQLGKGCVAFADGMLYCVDENDGIVVLVEASPQGWNERGRFQLQPQTKLRKPAGRIWTHPVIANGKLYLRDQNLIYCYDVSQG